MSWHGVLALCFRGDKVLGRDFTYVDDIVSGIVASLDYVPATCGERFNLGFGNPVSVVEMLNIIEKELDVPAKIVRISHKVTDGSSHP